MKHNLRKLIIGVLCSMLLLTGCSVTRWAAEKTYASGMEYFNQGDMEKAIETFTQIIEADVQYAEAYVSRAEAYLALGGEDAQEKAVADYLAAAELCIVQEELEKAGEILKKALESLEGNAQLTAKLAQISSLSMGGNLENVYAEDGSLQSTQEYDAAGNLVKESFYAEDGSLERVLEYYENHLLSRETGYYSNGNLRYIDEYDENRNLIAESDYNENGVLEYACEYDENGVCRRICYYDEDGNLSLEYEFDANDNCTLECRYTPEGEVVYRNTWEYTPDGQLTTHNYYDGEILSSVEEYDAKGNCIKESAYSNDKVINVTFFEYDAAQNCIKKTFCHPDGTPAGYWLYDYDENGNCIKESSYSVDSDLNETPQEINEYDAEGNLIRVTYYVQGILSTVKEYPRYEGGVTREIHYNEDGTVSYVEESP